MSRLTRVLLLLLLAWCASVPAEAGVTIVQTAGRYHAVFTPSPDHDAIEFQAPVLASYELTISGNAAAPIVLNLGKPAPVNGEIAVDIDDTIRAMASGNYSATLRGIGAAGAGPSTAPATFTLAPRVPGVPGSLQILIRTATETETLVDAATGAVLDQRTTSRTTTEVIER